ncbi:hypothetical protein [Klebsiella aerogenes]|uniref:hypothetical protein n=1 Tax=Klebsiella aerogenes TaxID=548 RepID=UPI002FF9B3D0
MTQWDGEEGGGTLPGAEFQRWYAPSRGAYLASDAGGRLVVQPLQAVGRPGQTDIDWFGPLQPGGNAVTGWANGAYPAGAGFDWEAVESSPGTTVLRTRGGALLSLAGEEVIAEWVWERYLRQPLTLEGVTFCLVSARGAGFLRAAGERFLLRPGSLSRQGMAGRLAFRWQPLAGGYGALRVWRDGAEQGWLAAGSRFALMPLGHHPVRIDVIPGGNCIWQMSAARDGGGLLLRHPECGGFLQVRDDGVSVSPGVPAAAHWLAGQGYPERALMPVRAMPAVSPDLLPLRCLVGRTTGRRRHMPRRRVPYASGQP